MKKERMIITGSEGLIGASVSSYMKDLYKTKKISLRFGHDLTDEIFVKEWFSQNKAEYLVNCFALNDHVYNNKENKTLFDVSLDSVSKYLLVNAVSMFSVCREFAKSQDAKGIVNLSSIYGIVSPKKSLYGESEKHIGYSLSKAAVIQLTKHLAIHLAPRIRVNCLAPGGVEHLQNDKFKSRYNEHVPMGRMLNKNELNGIIEYLCSDKSTYMTGSVINIDGGWTCW